MPKTKLGNETKDNGAKKARVETAKCEMSSRLDEEGLKFFQQAVVSSPNLEHLDSTCVDDIHQKTYFKPFLVKSRLGWLADK